MKTFLHGFVLILFALSSASVRGAVAANDVILTQRNSGNTTNIQSPVTATANGVIMYNDTLVPVSKTIVAGDNITVTQNAGNITINSTASGSGNVTTTGATANVVMVGGGSTAIVPLASIGTAGHPLVSAGAGAPPAFGVLTVPGGGTGASSITTGSVILGNGTGSITEVAPGSSGNILQSNGSAWISAAAGNGNVIANSALTNATFPVGNGTTGIGPTSVSWNATNSTITVGSAGAGNIIANVVTANSITVTTVTADDLVLGNVITGNVGGTGADNGSRVITYAGNVNISGAFTMNVTLTANTAVTMPTSGLLTTLPTVKTALPVTIPLTIDLVADGHNYGKTFIPANFTVSKIVAVHVANGGALSSPSIVATIKHGTDRTSGTTVEAVTVTSSTTGTVVTSGIDDATIPADSFVWVETGSKSGTTGNLEVYLVGTYD